MMRLFKRALLLAAGVLTARQLRRSLRKAPAETWSVEERRAHPGTLKRRLRPLARPFALFAALLAVGVFLVAASGIVPIKASSGHWAITRWFLNFSMQRSVSFHTLGEDAPPLDSLDSPGLVLKGAGHYETGCRPCHGSPELRSPRIAQEMTPHPPYLPPVLSAWEPEELFYIVKHGVKFTGMPAWPAQQRDDEVWAMVAFLRALPGLDAEGYRQLARGVPPAAGGDAPLQDLVQPEQVPRAVSESCGRCHGVDGEGRGAGAYPRLAGQRPTYLYAALEAYARGARHSGMMEPVAAGLSLEEMRTLARYYAGLQAPSRPPQEATPAVERGREIARRGVPRQGVPACADCHGPSTTRRNPAYPLLAGQYADYLVLQLTLFKAGLRGGSAYAHLMHPVATRLTPEQMRDVARYYASLPPGADQPAP